MNPLRCLLLVALASLGSVARADEPLRVVIPDPDSAFLPPAARSDLGRQLRALAGRYARLQVVPASPELTLEALRKQAGCADADEGCLLAMARATGADRLVWSQVQRLPGRSLVVVTVIDGRAERVVDTVRQRTKADPRALGKALADGFGQLFGVLVRTQLKLAANVGGAEVILNGRRIGQTPLVLTRELEAGGHVLELQKSGYRDLRHEFEVKPRQAQVALKLDLEAGERTAALIGTKIRDDEEPAAPDDEAFPVVPLVPATRAPEVPAVAETPPVQVEILEAKPGELPREDRPPAGSPPGRIVVEVVPEEIVRAVPVEGAESRPVYEKWWFWTAIGAVVVAGVVTGLVVGLGGEAEGNGIPSGLGRVGVTF
jgi:hypothetical protein